MLLLLSAGSLVGGIVAGNELLGRPLDDEAVPDGAAKKATQAPTSCPSAYAPNSGLPALVSARISSTVTGRLSGAGCQMESKSAWTARRSARSVSAATRTPETAAACAATTEAAPAPARAAP